jgi:hypothetical protein
MVVYGYGGLFSFWNLILDEWSGGLFYFILRKTYNYNFRISIAWLGREVFKGLKLEANNKIYNIRQKLNFVIVFKISDAL